MPKLLFRNSKEKGSLGNPRLGPYANVNELDLKL
jgi:hypothetical protein